MVFGLSTSELLQIIGVVLVLLVVVGITTFLLVRRFFYYYRIQDVERIQDFGKRLQRTTNRRDAIKIFVEDIIYKHPEFSCAIALFCQNQKVQYKVGYNVSRGALNEITFSAMHYETLINNPRMKMLGPTILDELNVNLNTTFSGVLNIPFDLRGTTQATVLFPVVKKKIPRLVLANVSVHVRQTVSRLYELYLESGSRSLKRSISSIEKSFVNVVDHSPNGVVILKPDLSISYLNSIIVRFFGTTKKKVSGKPFFSLLLREQDQATLRDIIHNVLSRKSYVEVIQKKSIQTANNILRTFDILCYPIFDGKDILELVVIFRNRTAKYRLEEELKLTQQLAREELESKVKIATQELISANKELVRLNELKTEFVSTISHELRTPLTSIKGYIALFLSGRLGSIPNQQKESLEIVKEETDRLHNLINDVLDLSKLESGKTDLYITKVDLPTLIKKIVDSMQTQLKEKKIKVIVKTTAKVKFAHIDEGKIKQVLVNLLSNSIKFSNEGKSITITLSQDEHYYIIRVADKGRGIPKTKLSHIFDTFYQVKDQQVAEIKGTGLGLAIVKNIVDLHKGTIYVASQVRKGTTFTVRLPKNIQKMQ